MKEIQPQLPIRLGYSRDCEYAPLFEFLKEKTVSCLQWLELDDESWQEANCYACFFSERFSVRTLPAMHYLSSEVRSAGAMDSVVLENGKYWPHNLLAKIFSEVIAGTAYDLNTQLWGYVAGQSSWARTMVTSLIHLGFSKIYWICENIDECEEIARQVRTAYFGVDLIPITVSQLNLQPSNGSVLINTFNSQIYVEEMQDLTYLNFIVRGGLVVDLQLFPVEKKLLEDSKSLDNRTINGNEVAWSWWCYFCKKWLHSSVQEKIFAEPLDVSFEAFESFLKTRPTPS